MARCRKLYYSDRKMSELRSHPEIQRYKAWENGPRAEQFRYDASKYDDLHRRCSEREADILEMVVRDKDLA